MTVAGQITRTEMCGGCGNADPKKRCIGCLHDFGQRAPTVAGQITDERLAEIIKGCEGVTPGPWRLTAEKRRMADQDWRKVVHPDRETASFTEVALVRIGNKEHPDRQSKADAAHLSRLDPQTVLSLLTELQHRRETEAGTPEGWVLVPREPTPAMLDAGVLDHAGELSYEDARACYDAMLAASPSSPASGVRVKALEWRNYRNDGSLSARTEFGLLYTVSSTAWGNTRDFPAANKADGIDAAKAAAQADYEARIRSALGEQP